MKKAAFQLFVIFVSLMFILAGARIFMGYIMEPDGYGFYDIWMSYLLFSIGITLAGILVMAHVIKRIERRLF
jgi:hypothetical protein